MEEMKWQISHDFAERKGRNNPQAGQVNNNVKYIQKKGLTSLIPVEMHVNCMCLDQNNVHTYTYKC